MKIKIEKSMKKAEFFELLIKYFCLSADKQKLKMKVLEQYWSDNTFIEEYQIYSILVYCFDSLDMKGLLKELNMTSIKFKDLSKSNCLGMFLISYDRAELIENLQLGNKE